MWGEGAIFGTGNIIGNVAPFQAFAGQADDEDVIFLTGDDEGLAGFDHGERVGASILDSDDLEVFEMTSRMVEGDGGGGPGFFCVHGVGEGFEVVFVHADILHQIIGQPPWGSSCLSREEHGGKQTHSKCSRHILMTFPGGIRFRRVGGRSVFFEKWKAGGFPCN